MTSQFGQFISERTVDFKTWVKESHAPSQWTSNATKSASALSDPYEILEISENELSIQAYSGFWRESHSEVCEDIKEWISQIDEEEEGEEVYAIYIATSLPDRLLRKSLWTKGRKHPDVHVEKDEVLVQFEVDSGNKDSSIFKLVIWLIDQNQYASNCSGANTAKTSGFYFPVGEGIPERVDVSWNDQEFKYKVKCQQIAEEDLDFQFTEVLNQAETEVGSFSGTCTDFTVPMTKAYIEAAFASDAFQLCSGASVVVMVPSLHKVYKHPLQASARETLRKRADLNLTLTAVPKQSPAPLEEYFECDAYLPPLNKINARTHIVPFMRCVIRAIQELHNAGIAHLDIKLENIWRIRRILVHMMLY